MSLQPTLWLDKIRAVPSVGIASKPTFDSGGHILARLKPLLIRWGAEHEEVKAKLEENMLLKIERSDGIHVHVSHQNVFCKFFYITDVTERGGEAPPTVDVRTPSTPYLELMERVLTTTREVATELYRDGNRSITRIGVVAEGNLDPSAYPPGAEAYFRHVQSPWGDMGLELNGDVIATLVVRDESKDICHHHFNKSLDESKATAMRLDWQRFYKESTAPNANKLMESVTECSQMAASYFARFGMGDLAYAE